MKNTLTNKQFEVVVITAEGSVNDEASACNALLEAGLRKLHIRKPHASLKEVKALILEIDAHFRDRLIVHEHHQLVEEMNLGGYHVKSTGKAPEDQYKKHLSKSFHAFEEIQTYSRHLNYGFLSPIYDSLSKSGYKARFSSDSLEKFLSSKLPFPIFALGGISMENVSSTKALGFQGAAVLGSIWQRATVSDRLTHYKNMINQV